MAMTLDEPLTAHALLDGAMKQARRHFRVIFPPVGIPLALSAACIPLVQGFWFRNLADFEKGPANLPLFLLGMGGFVVVILVFVALNILGYAALIAGATDAGAGRPVSMTRAWLAVVRPQPLFTLVIAALAVFAGFVCCILPGLYVGILFSLVVPVMVEEGKLWGDALGRSASLIQYNPRRELADDPRVRAFLIVFVGMLLGYAVSFIIQMPLIVVQQVLVMRELAGGERTDPLTVMSMLTWVQVPTTALATLAQVAVNLYVGFGLALLYFDVRRRQEGLDLQSAVDGLVQRAPAPATP